MFLGVSLLIFPDTFSFLFLKKFMIFFQIAEIKWIIEI